MATHYTYNSAPSKLNKKELFQEYIKLVEHSKKNDFLVSCNTPPTRTEKNKYTAMEDMIKAQKNMIKVYEERKEISDSLHKDYDDKIEYLENKIADLEDPFSDLHYDRVDTHIKEVCQDEFDFNGADNLEDIQEKYCELKEENEKYEELFNKVRAERDDIQHNLSEEINTLRKKIILQNI